MRARRQIVYKIISIIKPERFYIGSTVNLKTRINTHKHTFIHNKGNVKFQNHYNKYGWDDLVFSIIEDNDFISFQSLIDREQYYIDTLKPYFNVRPIADNNKGVSCSVKTRLKIGCSNKGKLSGDKNPMFGKRHKKESINLMSLHKKGNPLPAFTEEHCKKIGDSLRGIKRSYLTKKVLKERGFFNRTSLTPAVYVKIATANKKPILQFNIDGTLIKEWDCAQTIIDTLGFSCTSIRGACLGYKKLSTCHGFILKYKEDYVRNPQIINITIPTKCIAILQYDKNLMFVRQWDSIKEACLSLKISFPTIKKSLIKGVIVKGFIFNYQKYCK